MSVIAGKELDASLMRQWAAVQQRNPLLSSPYFSPEFTEAVAAVRQDVFITIEEGPCGPIFFPFQRMGLGRGRPVAGALNDCQGVIAPVDTVLEPEALLRASQLSAIQFDHLVAAQKGFIPFHATLAESPRIALGAGFEAYLAERKQAGSELISQLQRKRRKLDRELGPLRFEVHAEDAAAFQQMVAWKSRQYIESGLPDVLGFDWTVALLDRIRQTQRPDFAGMLSCLYAGEELLAVHLGMRSRTVWHYWFPAYNVAYQNYSPGLILLLMMAEAAPALGIEIIDLGKGDERYKQQLKNDSLPLAEAWVELPGAARTLRRVREGSEAWLRRSPFFQIARVPGRLVRKLESRSRFR